jgi:predicted amidophosphoribosyltransferase
MSDTKVVAATEMTPDAVCCPGCGGEMDLREKRCPHCGRPMGRRGFFFHAFWIALSLVVVVLIAWMFHIGFVAVNRML